MPEKKTKKPQAIHDSPTLFPAYRMEPLTLLERQELREFMATPLYRKLVKNAYCKKPSSYLGPLANWNEHSAQVSINRLHQIQGWEMFEAALFSQAEEKVERSKIPVEESFQSP